MRGLNFKPLNTGRGGGGVGGVPKTPNPNLWAGGLGLRVCSPEAPNPSGPSSPAMGQNLKGSRFNPNPRG